MAVSTVTPTFPNRCLATGLSNGILCLFVVILLAFTTYAQALGDNIRFKHITLEQGLSQQAVLAVLQDKQGYMWIGTQEGLNRFDGYQFNVFSHDARDSNTIGSDWIYSIVESNDNELWLGTTAGISVLDSERASFRHYKSIVANPRSLSDNNVSVLFKDSRGNIWVGTDKGLNRYIVETDNFVVTPLTAMPAAKIWSIVEDHHGKLWVGTDGKGLARFNPATGKVDMTFAEFKQKTGLRSKRIKALLVDNQQRLWVGTYDDGILLVDLNSMDSQALRHDPKVSNTLSYNKVKQLFQDDGGVVWVSTQNGLNKWDEQQRQFEVLRKDINNNYSLSGDDVNCVYQDRGGVFWIGTYSGLNKWHAATAYFAHYRMRRNTQTSLSNNVVNAIYQSSAQHVWIGTLGGLNLLDTNTGTIRQFLHDQADPDTIASNRVMALYSGHPDELWVATQDKGLALLDLPSGKFRHFRHDPADPHSISADGITAIQPAPDGKLWMTTFGGGLNLFDPATGRFTAIRHDPARADSLSSDRLLSIKQDSRGLLWLGTWGGGLNLLNPTTLSAVRIRHLEPNPSSLASDTVLSIYEDKQGNIWVGTLGGGLNKLSVENRNSGNFTFDTVSREQGLASKVIYGILPDAQDNLWLSTNRGLAKFNPTTGSVLNYDSSHGLQGNEFNAGAYYQNRQGRMFFGGMNGLTAFDPQDILPNPHVPPVVLTRFIKLNETMSLSAARGNADSIQISHHDYLIAFEFAALDYAAPSNNSYSYKLEGFDEDWIDAGGLRRATYTNLPAGQYVFRAKASNNDGIWNEQGTALALTVLPSPWFSWWAYTLYGFVALLLVLVLLRSYLHRLQQEADYRFELEKEVRTRTAELEMANKRLLNASVTDQLTGLHNRRYLASVVEQASAEVLRDFTDKLPSNNTQADCGVYADSGPRLFLLMFDLDGFKAINDSYGHDAGDQVICQVSQLLKSVCRKADTVIRWGGDEFLIMGKIEDIREAHSLAERIRNSIAAQGFDIGLSQRMHLSCSIGYSMYPFSHHTPDSLGWEQVQLIADRALYHSKESGRNQWSAIVASEKKLPFGLLNDLTHNLEKMLEEGYAHVIKASTLNVRDVQLLTERPLAEEREYDIQ